MKLRKNDQKTKISIEKKNDVRNYKNYDVTKIKKRRFHL